MIRLFAIGTCLATAAAFLAAPVTAEPCQGSDASTCTQTPLTSQDMNGYLMGLSSQTTNAADKQEIASLIATGSDMAKMNYLAGHSGDKTLAFIPQDGAPEKGVCTWITKTFCVLSCSGTGSSEQPCYNECKEILVQSC